MIFLSLVGGSLARCLKCSEARTYMTAFTTLTLHICPEILPLSVGIVKKDIENRYTHTSQHFAYICKVSRKIDMFCADINGRGPSIVGTVCRFLSGGCNPGGYSYDLGGATCPTYRRQGEGPRECWPGPKSLPSACACTVGSTKKIKNRVQITCSSCT